MAVRLPILAFLVLLSFWSASCQDDAYPSASPPGYPPTSTGPPSPSAFTYPPSPSQPPAYPPISVSPSQYADALPGSTVLSPSVFPYPPDLSQPPIYYSNPSQPPTYPPSVSPSQSADASTGPTILNLSAFAYPPDLSQPPMYPPSSSQPPTYPPNVSPSQSADASPGPIALSPSAFTYPPDPSQPPAYPPSVHTSHPAHASPGPTALSPRTFTYPPGPSQPSMYPPSVSPNQPAHASPGSITLIPTTNLPSPSPTVADQSPPMHPPSPSLPTYPPSASPSSPNTISYPPSPNQPTNPPSENLGQPAYPPSASVANPYIYPPSPSPVIYLPPSPSQDSPTPVAYPPSRSPSPSPGTSLHVAIPSPTYPPSPSTSSGLPHASSSPSPAPVVYLPSPNPPTYPPILSPGPSPSHPTLGLIVGHYNYSCPNAEAIVREVVKNATDADRGTGAGLILLFFHDCFIRGCDASVLLNTTSSGDLAELLGAPNLTLRGFEVINAAKVALEEACPGIVSCADILAFAGRDATYFLSSWTTDFDMPAGRYDGRVSLASETIPNLPAPFFGLQELIDSFATKGLNLEDMVTLSGAHTIGRSRCSSFSGRLPPNTGSDMDPALAASLQKQCSSGGDPTAMQDLRTPDDLDTQYYKNVINHEVLFDSDAALMASNQTASMVLANTHATGLWESKFKAAMVKMGGVGVKTRADGEIRKKCWIIN